MHILPCDRLALSSLVEQKLLPRIKGLPLTEPMR